MRYLVLVFVLCGAIARAQIAYPTLIIDDSQPWHNGNYNINNIDNIIFYNEVSNNAVADIIAGQEIVLSPNARISNFNNNGNIHFSLKTSSLLPVSFNPSGWNNIGLYEKFEIGVKIPPDIEAQIESFLNGGIGINPYDPNQIKLIGIYHAGSGFVAQREGFYYRDITLSGTSYSQNKSSYPFRLRFAPPVVGNYFVKLQLLVNNVVIDEFPSAYFSVIDKGHKGFLQLNNVGKLQDSRGNPVFGISQAIGFAQFYDRTSDYPIYPEFDKQRDYINDFADNSGNLVRVRLDPHSNEIEWEEVGVYGSNRKLTQSNQNENFLRQYHAFQLDKTLDVCDARGIYMFLTLMQDQALTHGSGYGTPGSDPWLTSPYSKIITEPQYILDSPIARQFFKQKLRYIIARWGFSANIGMFSLMNESDKVGDYSDNAAGANTRSNMESWHCEMSSFLKNYFPAHLTTTGYTSQGTSKSSSPLYRQDNSFACPSIDISSCNHYSTSRDVHKERHDDLPKKVCLDPTFLSHQIFKPFIFGEIGMTDCNPASDEYTDAEFHNSIWSTSMYDKAVGNGFYWYDWEQRQGINHRQNFKALASFFDSYSIGSQRYYSNWVYPGILSQNSRKIEWIELINASRTKGYGWVKNADYYWVNDPHRLTNWPYPGTPTSCGTSPDNSDPHTSTYGYPQHNEYIYLHGFIPFFVPYDIEIWSCYGNGGYIDLLPVHANIFGIIAFRRLVTVEPNIYPGPDFAYKIHSHGGNFRTTNHNSDVIDTIYLHRANPCIQVNGIVEDSTTNSHQWNFGNGQTSHLNNPEVCYHKEGLYNVSHIFKDSTNTTINQSQKIYVILIDDTNKSELNSSNSNLAIYPNPTSNSVFIKSTENITDIYVYNQLGEEVININNINQTEIEIKQLKSCTAGTYLVKVVYGNSLCDFKKIIKM